jgi:hypothetical protein
VSGDFSNNQLVRSIALDTNRFPFNAPTQTASAQPSTAERVQLAAAAQSQLPACQGSDVSRWTNCFGFVSYSSTEKYSGEFIDGQRHGMGAFTFFGGWKYVGEFKNYKRNGQGIYYKPDGSISATGNWSDDKLVQSFEIDTNRFPFNLPTQTAQPSSAERVHLAAVQSQLPACSFPVGQKWTDCFGTQIFSNGSMYVGEFKDGSFNGQGMEYYPNGSIRRQGRWENGNLVQSFAIYAQRLPFNSSLTASATQAPVPDPAKAERDRLAADLEASRKNAKDLEERLAAAQALTNNLPKPAAASVRNAHALVIGNAAYPGSGRLDNPVNDANAISQKLRSMGFTVTMVTDANRQRLVQAMAQFRRSAASADLSLLFYSGHGVQIFGTNYILPTDVDQTDTAQATIQGVRLNEVIGNFMPGKTKIVFLDACRDNPLQRTGDRSVTKGLAPISVAEGTLISYATKDGQTAADGVGSKNSPFTQALLEHLSDPQDIGVVLRKVREKVMRATGGKQQPWEYGSLTGGELVLSKIKGGR